MTLVHTYEDSGFFLLLVEEVRFKKHNSTYSDHVLNIPIGTIYKMDRYLTSDKFNPNGI